MLYHGKRGFFLRYTHNTGELLINTLYYGLRKGRLAVSEPDLLFSEAEIARKCRCTFCDSLICKETEKGLGQQGSNLLCHANQGSQQ